jgi:hypothetical protein
MIKTSLHRIANAVRFKTQEANRCWMVIGGTAAWPNESAPPDPLVTASVVNTPIGAKKCTLKWVNPSPTGEIQMVGPAGVERWTEVASEANAYTTGCRYVLVEAEIVGAELPTTAFREIGLFLGLTPTAGNEAATALLPAQISSYGRLQTIENRVAVTRDSNSSYKILNIFEF